MAQNNSNAPAVGELLGQYLNGDTHALTSLSEKLIATIIGASRRTLGYSLAPSSLEDIRQEVLLRIHVWPPKGVCPGRLTGWLRKVIRSATFAVLKKERRSALLDEQAVLSEPTADVDLDPGDRVDLLRRGIATLPTEAKQLVDLYYFHRVPCTQIARLLGVSEGCIHLRLHRIRGSLRQYIKAREEAA